MARLVIFIAIALTAVYSVESKDTASNLLKEIYAECLSDYSVSCVKPKSLAWMSRVAEDEEINITEDLSIVKTADDVEYEEDERAANDPRFEVFDSIDRFVSTHTLKVKVPKEISSADVSDLVPRSLLQDLPSELSVPLADEESVQEESRKKKIKLKIKRHGLLKKVIIPFLLGLKFKASVLVPLALALIALKTWKALTLGLISLVLSGAMVIFKFTKPKVVNYEVIHYPQHHVEHHVDHAPAGWDPHHAPYQARADDAQEMAYGGQMPQLP